MVGKVSPRAFHEISKLSISFDQYSERLYRLFLLYVQVEIYQNLLKQTSRALALTFCKTFLRDKKWFGTSLSASFMHNF